MTLSLKCQYAVRGVMELARRYGRGAVSISEIAKTYQISARFLEVILNELKRGGFVNSKRGVQGGFFLAVQPGQLTIGDILRYVEGSLDPVKCVVGRSNRTCPQIDGCVLRGVWSQARTALERIYDSANFADLIRQERGSSAADDCI